MAHPTKAEELSILERRRRVAAAYQQGKFQHEIAEAEGVARSQIYRDLAWVRAQWLESATADFGARQAEELAKLDNLEREAWEAWERSRKDAETRHNETTRGRTDRNGNTLPDLTKSSRTYKVQAGDPRFLERVGWCIQKRCELCGLLEVPGTGPGAVVTVVGGVDLAAVTGQKPGIPYETISSAGAN